MTGREANCQSVWGAEVRPIDENRMVVITRDSIVIGSTFEGAGTEFGRSSTSVEMVRAKIPEAVVLERGKPGFSV